MINQKILLVDDEASIRRFLKDVFQAEGFSVLEATSGDEALRKLKSNYADVVVMDVRMPGRDGLETLKEMRTLSLDTKTIIMTGYATVKMAVEAMKLGAFDYIVKPFENDELVEMVKAAIADGKKSRRIIQTLLVSTIKNPTRIIIGDSPVMAEIF